MFNYEIAQLRRADAACGRYELINPVRNQKKFWTITPVNSGSNRYARTWGRIGGAARNDASTLTPQEVLDLVESKVAKGYRRIH